MQQLFDIVFTPVFGHSILRISTSLIFASMAAVVSERAGVTNIGIEGMMLIAALVGVLFSAWTQSAFIGLFMAVVVSVMVAAIMAYFILNLKTHNVMSGLSINMLAKGLTVFVLFAVTGQKGASTTLSSVNLPRVHIPILKDIPVLGAIFSGQNVLTYLAFVTVALFSVFLYRTDMGLKIRAVGEADSAAQSVGINVKSVKFKALLLSGMFAGIAGAFLSMGQTDSFTANMTAGRGFIALAASSMGQVTPWGGCFAALFFGAADALANSLQILGIPAQFVQMIPYVVTVLGITFYSIREVQKQKEQARKISQTVVKQQ